MARGRQAKVGDTNVSANGYHYTRTKSGWQLTHRIIAEEILGRPLYDDERVRFRDGDRNNLDPNNIEVYTKGSTTGRNRVSYLQKRLAQVEALRDELLAELEIARGGAA